MSAQRCVSFLLSFFFAFVCIDNSRGQSAVILEATALYPDSMFTKAAQQSLKEGEWVEVLRSTVHEYPDASQDQLFKWYNVRTLSGTKGWIFGDALAIATSQPPAAAAPYQQHYFSYNNGFENAFSWFAKVEGHDNSAAKTFLNPPYEEIYWVHTNTEKRSVLIPIAGESVKGNFYPLSIQHFDLTGDGINEIIIEQALRIPDQTHEERTVEIYGFQAGRLMKLLEKPLHVSVAGLQPSPAPYKTVELSTRMVREAYCRFEAVGSNEWSIAFVTSSLKWQAANKQLVPLYAESAISLTAHATHPTLLFQQVQPSKMAVLTLPVGTTFKLLRLAKVGDEYYFFVSSSLGREGYVPAAEIALDATECSPALTQFFKRQPIVHHESCIRL